MRILLPLMLMVSLYACQHEQASDYKKVELSKADVLEANLNQEQIANIVGSYLKIKEALVNTNHKEASFAADNFLFEHEKSENSIIEKILSDVRLIEQSKQIEKQREYFEGLSQNVYSLVTHSKSSNVILYKQYCPMAFENKGAYWLSDAEKILNPYFGDKMLHCGKVIERID